MISVSAFVPRRSASNFVPTETTETEMLTAQIEEDESYQEEFISLAHEETRISKNVLKVVDVKLWGRLSFDEKQHEFKETCFAILNIVNLKLYRRNHPSLEQYFKKKWSVSRAQVYRLYESASVLRIIEPGCAVIPFKERQCRQLKNCVGLDSKELTNLWDLVLKATGSLEAKLASINVEDFFIRTLNRQAIKPTSSAAQAKKHPVPVAKPSAGRKSNENSDTEYSDTEYPTVSSSKRPRLAATPKVPYSVGLEQIDSAEATKIAPLTYLAPQRSQKPQKRQKLVQNVNARIDDRLLHATGLERDYLQLQESIHNLYQHGYALESLVNGQWERPQLFKLNTCLDLDLLDDIQKSAPSSCGGETACNGLDQLLLAAEWEERPQSTER